MDKSLEIVTRSFFSDIENNFSLKKGSIVNAKAMDQMYESVEVKKGSLGVAVESIRALKAPKEYTYQNVLRAWFKKPGLNDCKVGPHPDFAYLKYSGDIEHHHIVTMFVDIKRSSRLSLLIPLEEAYLVKNRILQACVDVIRALDGYPHRLMGDAVMAFFGDKNTSSEDAIANALNAASSLKLVLTESVFPELDRILGKDVNLGIRIGLDFGHDKEVIWANYGYGEASEVTALGLPVDLASKAQSQAKTNTAMIGQGILDHIDFPDFYSEIKVIEKNGETFKERYILPNMSNDEGEKLNRRCRLLKMDSYQELLPIPVNLKSNGIGGINLVPHDDIRFKCYYLSDDSQTWEEYISVSSFLKKDVKLKFKIEILNPGKLSYYGPLKAKLTKTNHGKEAENKGDKGSSYQTINIEHSSNQYQNSILKEIPEATAYRGLHTMEMILYPQSQPEFIIYKNIIGVFIV
ncbi:nucleotide-binding domain-containing protein [Zobellella sp. An-6]|uniref:nucleotide-binding domain-containing protein n=1 Tax=Zobellella sp. An-6 TaxID=3400218 RepID=UPI004041AA5D